MKLASSFNEVWLQTLRSVIGFGSRVEVRGTHSRELLGDTAVFPMSKAILTIPGRKISYDFMFAEAWWILSGSNRVEPLLESAPSYGKFSDDGIRLSGAYGPKIVDQIGYAVDCLIRDPFSRQAVINIWRERPGPSRDIPCTLSVQFLIRDGKINTIVTMRSNDVWLGMPYDVVTMTLLTVQLGIELNKHTGKEYGLGYMYHTAASRHVYDRDYEKAKSVISMEEHMPTDVPAHPIQLKRLTSLLGSSLDFQRMLYSRTKQEHYHKLLLPEIKQQHSWILYGITNPIANASETLPTE